MSSLHHVEAGNLPFEPEYAATWYACTGCGRCRTYCAHGNEVHSALAAGRSEAVKHGVAPEAAVQVLRDTEKRRAKIEAAFDGTFSATQADVAFVPGCTSLVKSPSTAQRVHASVEKLSAKPACARGKDCCGLPLLEAGDQAGFIGAAKRFNQSLAGSKTVIFADAGCQHALTKTAPTLGVPFEPNAIHLSEFYAAHLASLPAASDKRPARWLDPCRLGRGLGVYDAPRQVIAHVTGEPVREFYHSRDRAECSGAGGQLPRTSPDTARAIANERLSEHDSMGGGLLVAGCSSSAAKLVRQGDSNAEVVEFGEWISRIVVGA